MSNFMILLFMGPKLPEPPKYPSDNKDLQGSRDNVLFDLVQRDIDQAKYEADLDFYPIEQRYYKDKFVSNIGLVYEYLSESSPTSINGLPVFMSCKFLNHVDT